MELLNNKVAVITGGSKGIGKGLASEFYNQGASIILVSRKIENVNAAIKTFEHKENRKVFGFAGNINDYGLGQKIKEFALNKFGKVDILVVNSGGPPAKGISETSRDEWEEAISTNLLGPIMLTKSILEIMKVKKFGRIITINSTVAKEPSPKMILSASTRAGLIAFMKALSLEVANEGITVNTIATGGVKTERIFELYMQLSHNDRKQAEQMLRESEKNIPMGRIATTEEFARNIVWLASDYGSYITGQCIAVDGGLLKNV